MPALRSTAKFTLRSIALVLCCTPFVLAQGGGAGNPGSKERIIITRQDDPLARDPMRPNEHERQIAMRGAHSEIEVRLKAGNEARAATPPRYAEAEKAYLRVIELNPKEARAFLGLGNVYAAQNRVNETIEALVSAARLKPKMAEAHFNLGMVYWATGKKEESLKCHAALQELNKELAKKLKEFMDKPGKP